MENKKCEACKMLTLYEGLLICPLCLWEQGSSPNTITQTTND